MFGNRYTLILESTFRQTGEQYFHFFFFFKEPIPGSLTIKSKGFWSLVWKNNQQFQQMHIQIIFVVNIQKRYFFLVNELLAFETYLLWITIFSTGYLKNAYSASPTSSDHLAARRSNRLPVSMKCGSTSQQW